MEIAFLTYLNRSGSTYLASRLATFEAICMGIEARFKDGWLRPGFAIRDIDELYKYLDNLYTDDKFRSWCVDRDDLISALERNSYPIEFSTLLSEALRLHCHSANNQLFIHKCGGYYLYVDQIRKEFPKAKFIFIDRDPRAIFNSQSRSMDSATQLPMQTNVLHFLFGYIHTQHVLDARAVDPNFLKVSYEDLLQDEEHVLSEIISFLNVSAEKGSEGGGYFDVVPDQQKHLHTNVVKGAPVKSRLQGWQREMDAACTLLFQDVLRKQLEEKGYELYRVPKVKLSEWVKYVVLRIIYTYEILKRKIFNIEHKY